MHAKVKKPFPYAADHVTVEHLVVGDVRDFADDIAPGLEAAGYIEAADDAEVAASQPVAVMAAPPAEIPDDWRDLPAAGPS